MAQLVLSFPMRLSPNKRGHFVTLEQGSDTYKAQQLEAFIRTEKGERPILREFGIDDPSFTAPPSSDVWKNAEFLSEFLLYYPGIGIEDVEVSMTEEGILQIELTYV